MYEHAVDLQTWNLEIPSKNIVRSPAALDYAFWGKTTTSLAQS